MTNIKNAKNAEYLYCENCNFKCFKKSNWNTHIHTRKHEIRTNTNKYERENAEKMPLHNKSYNCNCGKYFKHASSLWNHKKKCRIIPVDDINTIPLDNPFVNQSQPGFVTTIVQLIKQNQDFKELLVEQNHTIIELSKKDTTTTNNNQKFNLNFFLNDTCKDAMNMSDFIENMNVQFEDIENIGRNGYVAGMTDLIISRIKNLDVTKRPMHCTDMKRETVYIKDNDVWEKDANNAKLHKMIGCIAHQNYGIIPAWRDKYPDSTNAETPKFEFCITMMRNVLGDAGEEQTRLDNKVIRNVTKHINVDKQPDTMET